MSGRNFKRIRFISKAMVLSGDHCFESMTENISINGLFIRTEQLISIGKTVAIIVYVPGVSRSSTLTVNCVVVRKGAHGLAFQFKALDPETFIQVRTVLSGKSAYSPPVSYLPTKP